VFSPRYQTALHPRTQLIPRAAFSAVAGLSRDVIQSRVFEVLKGFEKVDPAKVDWNVVLPTELLTLHH
jgi:NADH dehydrogenase (ubiquinone) 1 alpha/beta subcomplex 1